MLTLQITLGALLTLGFTLASWRSLGNPNSHGFYRTFGFVATSILLVINLPHWVDMTHPIQQIISFTLLIISLIFILAGAIQLRRAGGYARRENSPETLTFEETAHLVTSGIFRYVRHPMYSSLLFLTWGTVFKRLTIWTVILCGIATVAYILTAYFEERENLATFGEPYAEYRTRSQRFIPFIW